MRRESKRKSGAGSKEGRGDGMRKARFGWDAGMLGCWESCARLCPFSGRICSAVAF